MSNEQDFIKALGTLDAGTSAIVGSYVGEMVQELNQVKAAYEDRLGDIESLEKEVDSAVGIFKNIQSIGAWDDIGTWNEWNDKKLNERISEYIKGQELIV